MPCHNERVAKSRRREKEKRERERRAAAAAAGERPGSSGVHSTSEQHAPTKARSASDGSKTRTTPRSSEFPPSSTTKGPSSAAAVSSPPAPLSANTKRHSGIVMGLPASPAATRNPLNSESRSATTPLGNVENLAISSAEGPSKTLQKAKSYDDRQLNNTMQQQNTDPTAQPNGNGLLVPDNSTSRKEKRRSINPALAMTFNEQTPNNPFNSAPNTPLHLHMDRPTTPSKQESGHAPSPLREGAPNSLVSSPPSYARELDAVKPLHISNLARLQSDSLHDRPTGNRSRSASSTEQPTQHLLSGSSPLRSPMRMSFTLDRLPQRTTSRPENREPATDGGRITPQPAADGQDSPSLGVPNGLTRQRSFDSRHRNSSSSLGQIARSGSVSRPNSPAYRADVPHGIESGTDTEAESEETYVTDNTSVPDSLPPLPPKEAKALKAGTRPPHLKLDTAEIESDDHPEVSQVDSEDFSEDFSHEEGALVESTSHSTYIAPALPPIRFSVVGADFSDLLNTVGGSQESVKALEAIALRGKTNGVKTSDSAPRTPTSDRTVLGDAVDATPVQHPRREPTTNGIRKEAPSSQHLTSDSSRRSGENGRPSAEHSILRSVSSPDPGNGGGGGGVSAPKPTLPLQFRQRDRGASDASLAAPDGLVAPAQITVTPPEKAPHMRPEIADIVVRRLSEALQDSKDRGVSHIKMDTELLEAILSLLSQRQEESHDLKHKLDGVKVGTSSFTSLKYRADVLSVSCF